MNGTAAVIEAEGLTKRYGASMGCEDVSLAVAPGRIFGFLGRNGAGKSTFVKMMVGLIGSTSGRGELLGRPLGDADARARVGYLPEIFRYQEWMTPRELFALHGDLLGMERGRARRSGAEALEAVGLAESADAKLRSFSKGMQQRFGLACALFGEPDVIFLDEPTSALDPVGRRHVRELLVRQRGRGATVFLNSHLLSEVELVCDDVAFIDRGRIVESGPLERLLAGSSEVEVGLARPFTPPETLFEAHDAFRLLAVEDRCLVVALPRMDAVPDLVELLVRSGARIASVAVRKRSLESVFLERVGEVSSE